MPLRLSPYKQLTPPERTLRQKWGVRPGVKPGVRGFPGFRIETRETGEHKPASEVNNGDSTCPGSESLVLLFVSGPGAARPARRQGIGIATVRCRCSRYAARLHR